MSLADIITVAALILGVVSFALFTWHIHHRKAKGNEIADQAAAATSITPAELTELLKAFLSLGVTGPALAFLLASVFYMAIAAAGTGAFASKAAPPAVKAPIAPADPNANATR